MLQICFQHELKSFTTPSAASFLVTEEREALAQLAKELKTK